MRTPGASLALALTLSSCGRAPDPPPALPPTAKAPAPAAAPRRARTPAELFEAWKKALQERDGRTLVALKASRWRERLPKELEKFKSLAREHPDLVRNELEGAGMKGMDPARMTEGDLELLDEGGRCNSFHPLALVHISEEGDRAEIEYEVRSGTEPEYRTRVAAKEGGAWVFVEDAPRHRPERTVCEKLIDDLTTAVQMYSFDTNALPTSGSAALASALRGRNSKGYAYFAFSKATLNAKGEVIDPWGRPVVYINNRDGSAPKGWKPYFKNSFDLYSFGPNGKDQRGSGDDACNWQ